jgi:hypothetical protein
MAAACIASMRMEARCMDFSAASAPFVKPELSRLSVYRTIPLAAT